MFSTFDFASDHATHVTTVGARGPPLFRPHRSKTGCLVCRRRKKKCDEARPVCAYCDKRGLSCEWDIRHYEARSVVRRKEREREKEPRLEEIQEPEPEHPEPDQEPDPEPEQPEQLEHPEPEQQHPEQPDHEQQLEHHHHILAVLDLLPDLVDLDLPLTPSASDLHHLSEFTYSPFLPSAILISPSSTFNLFLDAPGMMYLNYYQNHVANFITISPASSNYFLKTFFTISVSNEAIAHALAAWGALFHSDNNADAVNHYLANARRLINPNPTDKHDVFITLAFYLISVAIQICSGDTSDWHTIFNKGAHLLSRYGGVAKFVRDFAFSNDSKFLIANFQYHDVMSLDSLANGTVCSMNSYNDLFRVNRLLEADGYGIDPYQGCIQPLFLLLGDIMNCYVDLKTEARRLLADADTDTDNVAARTAHYHRREHLYTALKHKIDTSTPNQLQLDQLSLQHDYTMHMKFFDLHRTLCTMYLNLYIKQTQPMSFEIQSLLLHALALIDDLKETAALSGLSMALLVCGVSCCTKYDRLRLSATYTDIYLRYPVGNVERTWDVVQEAWMRNRSGRICIDWLDICDDWGWKLSMC